ncbi:MAG: peptidoglycan DD-metalloendopeptidase family protein [Dehalococcoidia bacterium]
MHHNTALARFHATRGQRRPFLHGLVLVIISLAVGYTTLAGGIPGHSRAFASPITGLALPGVGENVPAVAGQAVLRPQPQAMNKTVRTAAVVPAQQQEEAAQFAALSEPPPSPTVAAPTDEDAIVRAAAVAPTPDLPPYQVYEVQDGDTVSSIAAKFGLSPEYITANNAEIVDADFLTLGQSIIVPAGNGILHEVRLGDTLSDIAARYEVDIEAITAFAANKINDPAAILEAQLVFVPGATIPSPVPVADPGGGGGAVPVETPPPGSAGSGPASTAGLIWPLYGPISSYMSGSHPLGIDVDAFNLPGAAVAAATSGTVIFAGGNACCSYGLYVVIMSAEGIETLYAHLDSIYVVQGQTVTQGDAIGSVGSSGYSTGRHLHFEVIDNGTRVDPLSYLP